MQNRKLTIGEMLYYDSDDSPESARIREEKAKKARAKAKAARAAKRYIYESLGLKAGRDSQGRVIWE